jgi:acyl-CoA synthetase (AMP-forming)/AMP-acid ligase II
VSAVAGSSEAGRSFGLPLPYANVAEAVTRMAERLGDTPAIYAPTGRDHRGATTYAHHGYRSLDAQVTRLARGLRALGLEPGTHVVLMVKPSLALFELVFALFRAGLVPVLVDPGLGIKNLGRCFAETRPRAFIGIAAAHVARLLFGWLRAEAPLTLVTVGRKGPWGGVTLGEVERLGDASRDALPAVGLEDRAAILFTSGSTGAPKGVEYVHRHFVAQVELLRTRFGIEPGEIDLPTFPLFALFDPALGMTTVFPEMDATRPAKVDPRNVFEPLERFGVTNMFGSPALLDTVSRAAVAQGRAFPMLRRIFSAGAPMTPAILERTQRMLVGEAEIFTPYGATEALPVAAVGSRFLASRALARTREGAGVCVGRPVAPQDVRLIRVDDGPIPRWDDALEVPPGTIGEITVRGPTVTAAYHGRDEATRLAKIDHGDGGPVRHRMGDLGYVDADGELWFVGRKSQRVIVGDETLHTVPIEEVFNAHPDVRRTALVGVRRGARTVPVLCVELEPGARPFRDVRPELERLGAERPLTAGVRVFLEHRAFPVDIRHNAKIFREKLAVWADGSAPATTDPGGG